MQTSCPDNGQTQGSYWAVVRANFAPEGAHREADFGAWWSTVHVPEYVRRNGFVNGRRLRALDAAGRTGTAEHRYLAIYEVERIAAFNDALAAGPPWGPWQEEVDHYLRDWERTYYRVTKRLKLDDGRGDYWVTVKVDLDPEADAVDFNRWYDEIHLPEITSNPGFHRAWRIAVQPDDGDLGNRRQRYWAVYEIDRPEDFVAARAARSARGIAPWDGIWGEHLADVQMLFYERLFEIDHVTALEASDA